MGHIFISHVEEDAEAALFIANALETNGYRTWYYERDSVLGISHLVQTGAAVEKGAAIVLIISANSLGSNQVTSEVVRGHDCAKPFLPVRIGLTHAEFQTRQPEWRQAIGATASIEMKQGTEDLTLQRILAGLKSLGLVEDPESKAERERQERKAAEAARRAEQELQEREAAEAARKAEQDRQEREAARAARKAEKERREREAAEAVRKAEQQRQELEAAKAARKAEQERQEREAAEAARKAEKERWDREAAEVARRAEQRRQEREAAVLAREKKRRKYWIAGSITGVTIALIALALSIWYAVGHHPSNSYRLDLVDFQGRPIRSAYITSAFFNAANVQVRGRLFSPKDYDIGCNPVVLISSGFAQRNGYDMGRDLHLDSARVFVVVGIVQPQFLLYLENDLSAVDIWLPGVGDRLSEVPRTDCAPSTATADLGDVKKDGDGPKTQTIHGLEYVWIPPGQFSMGCSQGDNECRDDEKSHEVTLTKGFWIGQTEVTQEAYLKVIKQNPSHFRGDSLPVEMVTWAEAANYCTAVGMRLPTEAEWEYAARGGNPSSSYGPLKEIAWYSENSEGKTHEVGGMKPNKYGLYDMLGNVYEWTADLLGDYPLGPTSDPSGLPPSKGFVSHVFRGGSWLNKPQHVRSSHRGQQVKPDFSSDNIGFRCAGAPQD